MSCRRIHQQAGALAFIAAAVMLNTGEAHAQPAAYPAYPAIEAERGVTGEQAIEALGARLPAVAAWYGWSPKTLKQELTRAADIYGKALKLDAYGQIYIDEGFDYRDPPVRTYDTSAAPREPLSSKPDATRKIVLSFRGVELFGSAWNGLTQSGLRYEPFDIDGNPSVLSDAERNRIARIWQNVADDFAPFDVDVTTQDVADADLLRSGPDDTTYGIRVVIYSRSPDRCACDASVYLKSFGDPRKPILLNATALGRGDPLYVADAVSHLVGHSLGLREDFENRQETPTIARLLPSEGEVLAGRRVAPIMGSPFEAQVSRFAAGNYPNAANSEPDFAVIEKNGLPLQTDKAGHSGILASYPASWYNFQDGYGVLVDGVIERPGDGDVYAIHSGAGWISARVEPFWIVDGPASSNLKYEITLWSTRAKLMTVTASETSAELDYTAPAPGTYYLSVRPVRERTGPGAAVEYGNRGRYHGFFRSAARVTHAAPVAELAPAAGERGQSITLRADGSTAERPIARYKWDFGDGSATVTTTVPWAAKTYARTGTYKATVQVTDVDNYASTAQARVDVVEAMIIGQAGN